MVNAGSSSITNLFRDEFCDSLGQELSFVELTSQAYRDDSSSFARLDSLREDLK